MDSAEEKERAVRALQQQLRDEEQRAAARCAAASEAGLQDEAARQHEVRMVLMRERIKLHDKLNELLDQLTMLQRQQGELIRQSIGEHSTQGIEDIARFCREGKKGAQAADVQHELSTHQCHAICCCVSLPLQQLGRRQPQLKRTMVRALLCAGGPATQVCWRFAPQLLHSDQPRCHLRLCCRHARRCV